MLMRDKPKVVEMIPFDNLRKKIAINHLSLKNT